MPSSRRSCRRACDRCELAPFDLRVAVAVELLQDAAHPRTSREAVADACVGEERLDLFLVETTVGVGIVVLESLLVVTGEAALDESRDLLLQLARVVVVFERDLRRRAQVLGRFGRRR